MKTSALNNLLHPTPTLKVHPDPILRQVCAPIERFDSWLSDVVNEMFLIMDVSRGIGLAAPQVGLARRFFVAGIKDRLLCLINPEIISSSGQEQMNEGCLSLPGVSANVARSTFIRVSGYTLSGQKQFLEFEGLWARMVQHESDHLNGILICDHKTSHPKPQKIKVL